MEASSGKTRDREGQTSAREGCADELLKTEMAKALGGNRSLRTNGWAGPGHLETRPSHREEWTGLCGVELATL